MTQTQDWRSAKMPKWVKDAIEAELKSTALHAALTWPTEPQPEPLPFQWGYYDRLVGEPREGIFWDQSAEEVHIKANDGTAGQIWKAWMFSTDGERWSTSVRHGPLFATKRDALLYILWRRCHANAAELHKIRESIRKAES